MSEGETEKQIETMTLRAAIEWYGDTAALAQLAQLGREMGEEHLENVLSGRPRSHWEKRATQKRGFDVDAIRAALIEPVVALLASGELICVGCDSTQPLNRKKVTVPRGRIADFVFDFSASEASCGDTRLIHVVVGRAKGKLRPARVTMAKFRKWYVERLTFLVENEERSNFDRDMKAARAEFGDRVTHRMVKDIRRQSVPDSRKKPGPNTELPARDDNGRNSG